MAVKAKASSNGSALARRLAELPLESLALASLRAHPRNYQEHPADQLAHLQASLQEHGAYRNIVVARDGTILAGHGIVQAALALGWTHFPGRRLPLDPFSRPALKLLAADNEVTRLALKDDRALADLLKELATPDPTALLGTGFDQTMLAALAYTTRPASELADKHDASQWVGLPAFDEPDEALKCVVTFRSPDDRQAFAERLGLSFPDPSKRVLSTWWPPRAERDDLASLRFEG